MRQFGFPFLPLVLGLVLGYLIEANYRRSLLLTSGDHIVFLQDPVSLGLLITALVFVIGSAWRDIRSARRQAAEGESTEAKSEEHTSELQSLMRISYAVFCLKKKKNHNHSKYTHTYTT